MELHHLTPAPGATESRKRIGRGEGSKRGGTATRGHKGAQSRSGYKSKRGFEGGQMPLARRVPKVGFKNPHRIAYKPINLGTLATLAEKAATTTITPDLLRAHGLLGKGQRYKVLAQGSLPAKLAVTAHAFSATAKEAITAQGGTTTTV